MPNGSRRPKPRIESLTDLIFGLALSIGALGLLNNKPTTALEIEVSVGSFAFSFFILMSIWLRYTEIMSVLPFETDGTRTLNVFLLFLVAMEPYLFNLIGSPGVPGDPATIAYALDLGTIYAILALFNNILASEERHLIEPALLRKYRVIRNVEIMVAAVFYISILPPLYSSPVMVLGLEVPARIILWILNIFFSRLAWLLKRTGRL